jgi:hypothetical protein
MPKAAVVLPLPGPGEDHQQTLLVDGAGLLALVAGLAAGGQAGVIGIDQRRGALAPSPTGRREFLYSLRNGCSLFPGKRVEQRFPFLRVRVGVRVFFQSV